MIRKSSSFDRPVHKVLVANRGEIARRIIQTLNDQGLESVAVYADQDADALYVQEADEAYALQGTTAATTYLDATKILEIARRSGANAIHPGYGFLAEEANFAQSVLAERLVWVGPSPAVLRLLGDKITARQTAIANGVTPVPGSETPVTTPLEVENQVERLQYPVVIKAADGGGGRGIHVLTSNSELEEFLNSRDLSDSNAAGFFVEKYVANARHLETQCGRDSHGSFAVYSTRDCSVQRRHQKLIEEAPAPYLPEHLEQKMFEASKKLFDAVDYVGIGTVEFLLDEDGSLYFLEVNPRLQVEHTVTEEVTGLDLVDEQLIISSGGELTGSAKVRGHSIEMRVTSEDPLDDLLPTTGTLSEIRWPTGPGVRIDTGVTQGDQISPDFDSMIAKIIVTAPSRRQALKRARRAAADTQIEGIKTPLGLYKWILAHPLFGEAAHPDGEDEEERTSTFKIWTKWLETEGLGQYQETVQATDLDTPADKLDQGEQRANPPSRTRLVIEIDGRRTELVVPSELLTRPTTGEIPLPPQPLRASRDAARRAEEDTSDDSTVRAPIQAIVVRVLAAEGEEVAEGDTLVVLEAMKMETYVNSPRNGVVQSVLAEVGGNVVPGQVLVELESE